MSIQRFDGNGRMSKAVIHNGVLYLCGQTGTPGDDIKGQTKEILERIEKLLEKYGSNKNLLLVAEVYLSDMRLFDDFNSVWDTWIEKGNEPTRTCVEARASSPHKFVEVTVRAALKD